jgi:parallel beta-helix repeat protein
LAVNRLLIDFPHHPNNVASRINAKSGKSSSGNGELVNYKRIVLGSAAAAALAVPALGAASAQAGTSHFTVYVSEHGSASARDASCGSAAYTSIGAGVSAVAAGGTVVVCGGTYHEDVTVAKPLSLAGRSGAVIDATGHNNGVLVTAGHVTVSGLRVTNAIGEGILVSSADHVTIAGNVVTHNDLGGVANPVPNTYAECQAQGAVPGDCGEGIHLMASSYATVAGNVSTGNSGGILLTDETGPAAHNRIVGNVVAGNLFDCGITVVGHNPKAAPGGVPAPQVAGVYANDIQGNDISGNGLKGAGAGVVLATPLPGGAVYDNTIQGNSINGNGMSGVSVHSHVPGQFLNGNVITHNMIGTNNVVGDSSFAPHVDKQTTGVLVGTVTPLSITVSGNVIAENHFGIWTTGQVTAQGEQDNVFAGDAVPVAQG